MKALLEVCTPGQVRQALRDHEAPSAVQGLKFTLLFGIKF